MTTLAATHPTLLDVTRRLDPDGKIDMVAEILAQTNPILEDMVWVEGNLPTGHRSTVRTGLPAPTWRKLYGGVQPTKSTTAQVTDSCGMLEAYAEVDKALADLNGNTAAFRLSEDKAFIEGMSQEFAQTLIYGNEGTEPEAFTGFSPRYKDISDGQGNVISSGGASAPDGAAENSSIWLIGWGPDTIHGIYPKGSQAGLSISDKGQVTIENIDGVGGRMEAYRTHYRWDCGLCVRDWRYAVRIAFDAEDLLATLASGPNLIDLMVQAEEMIPNLAGCRPVFYANRATLSMLRRQIITKASYNLSFETVGGKHVTMFDGIPVKRCDAILNTEGTTAGNSVVA